MKTFKKVLSLLLCSVMLVLANALIAIPTLAASNPYPSSQTFNGVSTIPCTYYAWQQAYDNTGVAMPNFGNAKNWYTSAQNNGYSTGSTPKAKSIAVWTNSGYGHVAYVVSVNGSTMKVNEGGMYNTDGTACNGNGIINGSTCNSTVGSKKSNYSSSVLVGFIYLSDSSSSSVTFSSKSGDNKIYDNNAIVYGSIDKPSSFAVTKIGIRVRKEGSSYNNGWSVYQAPVYSDYTSWTSVPMMWDFSAELGFTPTHATKYYYQFYTITNGKEYWSDEYSITTTGSHSYSSWSTVSPATCTANGSAKRSCACGKTETKTLTALGHNYSSSYTTDTPATCTTAGSKSKHCSRCSSKTSVTSISATGHSWSSWKTTVKATCTTDSKQERSCSVCKKTETKTIAKSGHSYSGSWTIDKAATCTTAGTKSKHCQNCSAKTSVTTINPTGHNWSEFEVTSEPTTEKTGTSIRHCKNSDCTATESKTLPKLASDGHTHSFGEYVVTKEATCTEAGEAGRSCAECKETETQTLSPLGHSFGEWSTPNENGVVTRICSLCSTTEEHTVEIISSDTESSAKEEKVEEIQESDSVDTEDKSNNANPLLLFGLISLAFVIGGEVSFLIFARKKK